MYLRVIIMAALNNIATVSPRISTGINASLANTTLSPLPIVAVSQSIENTTTNQASTQTSSVLSNSVLEAIVTSAQIPHQTSSMSEVTESQSHSSKNERRAQNSQAVQGITALRSNTRGRGLWASSHAPKRVRRSGAGSNATATTASISKASLSLTAVSTASDSSKTSVTSTPVSPSSSTVINSSVSSDTSSVSNDTQTTGNDTQTTGNDTQTTGNDTQTTSNDTQTTSSTTPSTSILNSNNTMPNTSFTTASVTNTATSNTAETRASAVSENVSTKTTASKTTASKTTASKTTASKTTNKVAVHPERRDHSWAGWLGGVLSLGVVTIAAYFIGKYRRFLHARGVGLSRADRKKIKEVSKTEVQQEIELQEVLLQAKKAQDF